MYHINTSGAKKVTDIFEQPSYLIPLAPLPNGQGAVRPQGALQLRPTVVIGVRVAHAIASALAKVHREVAVGAQLSYHHRPVTVKHVSN